MSRPGLTNRETATRSPHTARQTISGNTPNHRGSGTADAWPDTSIVPEVNATLTSLRLLSSNIEFLGLSNACPEPIARKFATMIGVDPVKPGLRLTSESAIVERTPAGLS